MDTYIKSAMLLPAGNRFGGGGYGDGPGSGPGGGSLGGGFSGGGRGGGGAGDDTDDARGGRVRGGTSQTAREGPGGGGGAPVSEIALPRHNAITMGILTIAAAINPNLKGLVTPEVSSGAPQRAAPLSGDGGGEGGFGLFPEPPPEDITEEPAVPPYVPPLTTEEPPPPPPREPLPPQDPPVVRPPPTSVVSALPSISRPQTALRPSVPTVLAGTSTAPEAPLGVFTGPRGLSSSFLSRNRRRRFGAATTI